MSRVGGRDAGTVRPEGPESSVGDAPRPRRDGRADHPSQGMAKGAGGRDARLGTRDGRGAADSRAGASAESFERSLEQALAKEAGGRGGSDPRRDDERPGEGPGDEPAASALPGVMAAFQVPGPATAAGRSRPDQPPAIGSHGRRAALSSLWAQDDAAEGAARRGAAAATEAEARPDEAAERAEPVPRGGARRLLAEAGAEDPAISAVPQAGPLATQAPARPGAAASGEAGPAAGERAARVAETVERAIRAEDAPAPGQVVSLDIALDPLKDGLGAVTVTLATDSVEIVLAHAGAIASADLRGAAQALADRLQRRFPNRAVRVFEEAGRTARADRPDAPDHGST